MLTRSSIVSKRAKVSVQVLPIATLRDARLSPEARAVLALALTFSTDELPTPFLAYLKEQGIGDRPAARAITELEAHGYLERRRVPVRGKPPTTRAYIYSFRATPVVFHHIDPIGKDA